MVVSVRSLGLNGITGYEVTVECDVSGGMPAFDLVGLPDAAVREARERVRSAARNCGYNFPNGRVTVNLAPAGRRKEGTVYDLPILLGILLSSGQLSCPVGKAGFVGEVSLGGELRPVRGMLPMAMAARAAGMEALFVPEQNAAEAALAEGITIYAVRTVRQLTAHLLGEERIAPTEPQYPDFEQEYPLDYADVKGQGHAKRALEIAAAGGHHLLMMGPPGTGKSMMARRLPSILPKLTMEEALETTQLWSVSELLDEHQPLVTARPFRAPHHTVSTAAMAGGGLVPRPGEVSLAHNGVLFLDETPEFSANALEVLRQPLEDGVVQISRVSGTMTFPSRFMLVCAMNPCKCGWYGHPKRKCTCSDQVRKSYLKRISGPLLDRIDMKVFVSDMKVDELTSTAPAEPSAAIRERVERARELQRARYRGTGIHCNAQMTGEELREYCALGEAEQTLMKQAYLIFRLTARSYDKLLRVSRTIADLAGEEKIAKKHIAEALQYKAMDEQE